MNKRYLPALLITAAAGSALHFAYDLWPVPFVGLFAPVNESVWEHLKLLYWPFLAAAFFLNRKKEDKAAAWNGYLTALLAMPVVLLGVHYTLAAGFLVEALWIDIALYVLCLALGFHIAFRMEKVVCHRKLAGILILAVGLCGASLVFFTLAPPDFPVFIANSR